MGLFKTKHIVIITIYISVWIIALPSTYGENENTNKTSLVYRNITSRDRSAAKFFSERLKVSQIRDEKQNKSWPSVTPQQSNRRAILNNRLKLTDECERNCRRIDNEDNCKLKCDYEFKLSNNNTTKLELSKRNNSETSTTESNLVSQSKDGKDEILESEESVLVADSISNNDSGYRTKELSKNKNDKMEKYLKNMILLKSRTTTKIAKRKTTSTTSPRSRPTIYRGRVKYSPSSARIREESLIPYGSTIRYSNFSKIYTQGYTPTSSRTKEKDLEIMDVSDPRQSSTEKMRFLKSRNIVAINNYVKRLNTRIASIPKLIKNATESVVNSTIAITSGTELTSTEMPILEKVYNTTDIPVPNIDNDLSTIRDDFPQSTVIPFGIKREIPETINEFSTKIQDTTVETTTVSTSTSSLFTTSVPITTQTTTTTEARTTKRFYTSIPRRKQLTTYSTTPKAIISTIPSILNNTVVQSQNSTYLKIPMISTTKATTPPYIINDHNAITEVPIEVEVLPSMTSDAYTTTSHRPQVLYESISTTSVNDIAHVEAQNLNVTAYALGGFCFLPVVLVALYFVKSYMMRHKSSEDYHADNDIQPISPVVTLNNSDDSIVYFDENEESLATFNRNKLRFKSLLGEGNFGQVWKAEIDDVNGSTKIVAVKTERINNGQSGLKSECEIMQKLGSHLNVVTLIAACVEQEPHLLIMEFAMRGRLLSLLRTARSVSNGLHHNTQNRQPIMPLSPRRLTGFAHDIAKGMEYIANKRIVHCDLAARNILLDHNGICKICDFGMSIDLDKMESRDKSNQMKIPRVSTHQKKFKFDMTSRVFDGIKNYASRQTKSNCDIKNRPAMPVRWMAPESLQYHIYSIETDVFAFGILLWEIVTLGITPYPTLSGREVIRGVLNGVRPEIPINCKQELSDVMTHCWHKSPSHRPSFFDIKKALANALLHWQEEPSSTHTEYLDVSGFSEDYENGMIYFNRRISEFECEI
ncbi:hypothetical protein ACKWTF_011385 [Chironomus riparius]